MSSLARVSRHSVIAQVVEAFSHRGTCYRASVGAVLALDGRVLVTGYNGPPSGLPHCSVDCKALAATSGCTRAVHAEANAIAFAAKHGIKTEGTHLYCSFSPCLKCAELLINAGVTQVTYTLPYRIQEGEVLLKEAGIDIMGLNDRLLQEEGLLP